MLHGLLFGSGKALKTHHAPIIRISGPHHSPFVPVIQNRNARYRRYQRLQHAQAVKTQGIHPFHLPIPTSRDWIFVKTQGFGCVGNESRHIVIPRYIPHAVLMAVIQKRFLQALTNQTQITGIRCQGGTGIKIKIEIKLRIDHPTSHIGTNQLPTSKGLPDLVNRTTLRSYDTLFDFAG